MNFVKIDPIKDRGELRYVECVGNNHLQIVFENGVYLQSYSTVVAAKIKGQLFLNGKHDCSVTTNKYVKQFCGLSASDRRKGLVDGSILPLFV